MSAISQTEEQLRQNPKTWLITGVAGFIGSNILERLLNLGQKVIGLDNFSSGSRSNIHDAVAVNPRKRRNFDLIEGDICNFGTCLQACNGVDYVLHQAAIVSVPRSLLDPIANNQVNVDGTINVLLAARDSLVRRVVFASSSAVYGNATALPLPENHPTTPLSPYGLSKLIDEQYASVFSQNYELESVGLRYFNVFGPRQDPLGGYAAVIPQWIHHMNAGATCHVHGDGLTSRDFVSVRDVVQANILAATAALPARHCVYNVGAGRRTSLNELHDMLARAAAKLRPQWRPEAPIHGAFREGDVRHSQADIARITADLGYAPAPDLYGGLEATTRWYFTRFANDQFVKPSSLREHEPDRAYQPAGIPAD